MVSRRRNTLRLTLERDRELLDRGLSIVDNLPDEELDFIFRNGDRRDRIKSRFFKRIKGGDLL